MCIVSGYTIESVAYYKSDNNVKKILNVTMIPQPISKQISTNDFIILTKNCAYKFNKTKHKSLEQLSFFLYENFGFFLYLKLCVKRELSDWFYYVLHIFDCSEVICKHNTDIQ